MKSIRRVFAALVALAVITASFAVPAAAKNAAGESCNCGDVPYIYVAALGSATLYQNAGAPDEKVIFRPETETYLGLVKELALPLVRLLVTRDYNRFGDSLIAACSKVFGPLAMQDNGDSTADITTKRELPSDPAHGKGRDYYFGYDFRADPLVTAEKLRDFIEHVEELTGHERVSLRASSMGGVMTMAYLEKYGTGDIKDIVFQCCPLQGTAVAGELFNGKIEVDSDALYRYAYKAIPALENDPLEIFLRLALDTLRQWGGIDFLAGVAGKLVDNLGERVMRELLVPVFRANCGIWSFVPDEYYEDAKKYMLGDNPNAQLEARLDDYHYNVQCSAGEILTSAVEDGVRVMILAGYNMQRTPLVTAYLNDSDGTVDTKYASAGATVAQLGGTLTGGQINTACGHNHLSADGRIDASTCILPEYTWFVKDMLHSNTHEGHRELYNTFYYYEGSMNVFSDAKYPQFLQNDTDKQCFTPVTAPTADTEIKVTLRYTLSQYLKILRSL